MCAVQGFRTLHRLFRGDRKRHSHVSDKAIRETETVRSPPPFAADAVLLVKGSITLSAEAATGQVSGYVPIISPVHSFVKRFFVFADFFIITA